MLTPLSIEEAHALVNAAQTDKEKLDILWSFVGALIDAANLPISAVSSLLEEKKAHDALWATAETLSEHTINCGTPVTEALTDVVLADLYAMLEAQDHRVVAVYLSFQSYAALRKQCQNIMDIETRREILAADIMGWIWGATLYVCRYLKPGEIRLFGEGRDHYSQIRAQVGTAGQGHATHFSA